MSLQSAYDAILEDMVCPRCGWVGMAPDGGFEYCCRNPECDFSGSLEDDGEDENEEDED